MSYIGRGIDQIDNISTLDNLSFNGSDATFNLTQNSVAFVPVSADALQIQIDGVIQANNFTISGSTVTFDFTPNSGSVCNSIKHFGVGLLTTVSDGAVTSAKLGNNSVGITQLNVSDGTNGQALTTNGSGTLAFASVGADADNYFESGLSSKDLGNGLHVKIADSGGSVNANRSAIVVEGTGDHGMTIVGNNAGQGGLWFANQSSTDAGQIDYNHPDDTMRFYTGGSERLRIHGGAVDSDKVSIGTSSAVGGLHVMYNALDSTSQGTITVTANNSGNSTGILFLDGQNQNCGRITVKGGDNTSQFYTSSDHRLKQDVAPLDSSLETIKSLQPKKYKWNTNPDSGYHEGFLAHELQSLVPDAVTGKHNEVDSEGNPIYQGVDKTAIIPHLTKALQEAITKIETLETENTDIKARLTALENA